MAGIAKDQEQQLHAELVAWPRSPADLTSTATCPACFATLRSPVCSHCGLDLGHPAARDLLELSQRAATALERRIDVIGRIRFETDAAARARSVVAATPAVASTAGSAPASAPTPEEAAAPGPGASLLATSGPATPGLATSGLATAGPATSPSAAASPARRTSSVQLVMLVIGVSALSVGAIFFLVYAFINYGIGWRSAIIGSITVAAFAVATFLRRLRATSEGIAAFAVVLVYLDAYAVRANGLLGADRVDGALFWGSALVVSSAIFLFWHRRSALRIPSVVGFAAFAPGVGLVVFAAASGSSPAVRTWLVFTSIALAALIYRFATPNVSDPSAPNVERRSSDDPVDRQADEHASRRGGRRTERAIVLGTALLALVIASLAAATLELENGEALEPVLALITVAIVAAGHVVTAGHVVAVSPGGARAAAAHVGVSRSFVHGSAILFASIFGVDLAVTGFVVVLHASGLSAITFVPCVAAIAVTLALELLSRRTHAGWLAFSARTAAWAALAIAAVAIVLPLGFAAIVTGTVIDRSLAGPWAYAPMEAVAGYTDAFGLAILGLASVAALTALAWATTGLLRRRASWLGFFVATLMVLAVPLLGAVSLIMACWFALAGIALAVLVVAKTGSGIVRGPLVGIVAAGTILGWSVGWASGVTWPIAAVATIILALTARSLGQHLAGRAALLGAALLVLLTAAGTAGRALTGATFPSSGAAFPAWTADSTRLLEVAAVLVLGGSALSLTRVASALDRRTAFWIGIVTATGGAAALKVGTDLASSSSALALPESPTDLIASSLLLLALLLWASSRGTLAFRLERAAASVVIAPAAYLALDALARITIVSEPLRATAPTVAALLTGIVSLALTMRRRGVASRPCLEVGIAIVGVPAVLVAVAGGGDSAWAVVLLAAITAVVVSVGQPAERASAALIGTAVLLLPIAAALGAAELAEPLVPVGGTDDFLSSVANPARFAGIAAVLLLAASALPLGRVVRPLGRRTGFWVAGAIAGGTLAWLQLTRVPTSTLLPEPGVSLVTGALLLVALLLWVGLRVTARFRIERMAASVALAPALYLAVDAFARVIDAPNSSPSVAPISAAVLVSGGSLAVTLVRPSNIPRRLRDAGIALVAVPAVLGAIGRGDDATWLVLLLAAIAVLLVSVSADGLFASSSPRKRLGWLSMALATTGFWWRLSATRVTAVEEWVLPISGLLLLVALLMWRASRTAPSLAAPLVELAALLTAILPISVAAGTGTPLRALAIGTVSAMLLLVGSFATGRGGMRPYLDAAALAGALGVIVTGIGRALFLLRSADDGFALDAWLGSALLVLFIAAFGLAASRSDPFVRQRALAGQVLAIVALTAVVVLEFVAILEGSTGAVLRPFAVTMLFSAIHVVAFLIHRTPFTPLIAWLSIGYAAVTATIGVSTGTLTPIETGTAPLALALIATGVVQLERDPHSRSWPWLAPGVTVLLLPSLLATVEDRPIWRLVAIGAVGIATIVIGAARRLQAPFVIASAVVIVHIVATFTPQIRAAYQFFDWWLWLALGGVVLIVLAARYEQRIQNLRDVARRVGSLR